MKKGITILAIIICYQFVVGQTQNDKFDATKTLETYYEYRYDLEQHVGTWYKCYPHSKEPLNETYDSIFRTKLVHSVFQYNHNAKVVIINCNASKYTLKVEDVYTTYAFNDKGQTADTSSAKFDTTLNNSIKTLKLEYAYLDSLINVSKVKGNDTKVEGNDTTIIFADTNVSRINMIFSSQNMESIEPSPGSKEYHIPKKKIREGRDSIIEDQANLNLLSTFYRVLISYNHELNDLLSSDANFSSRRDLLIKKVSNFVNTINDTLSNIEKPDSSIKNNEIDEAKIFTRFTYWAIYKRHKQERISYSEAEKRVNAYINDPNHFNKIDSIFSSFIHNFNTLKNTTTEISSPARPVQEMDELFHKITLYENGKKSIAESMKLEGLPSPKGFIKDAIKFNISAGIGFTGLVDHDYKAIDTVPRIGSIYSYDTALKKIDTTTGSIAQKYIYRKDRNWGELILTTLVHFYYTTGTAFNVGGTVGIGVSQSGIANFLVGGSFIFGRNERIVFSSGLSLAKVDRLNKDLTDKKDPDNPVGFYDSKYYGVDEIKSKRWTPSWFCTITWNLIGSNKSFNTLNTKSFGGGN